MNYYEKPRIVKAMQYDGTQESANEIETWLKTVLGDEFTVSMIDLQESHFVVFGDGLMVLAESDFHSRFGVIAS